VQVHARIVSLENMQLQIERQSARYVLAARTPLQQGPVHARLASLENIQLQVERQSARYVLAARTPLQQGPVHARLASLENIQLQVERQSARYVLAARTPLQQGPVHARLASLENIQLQVERQCACLVLSIRLRQSRAQHSGRVFVSLVSPAPGRRARFRVLRVLRGVVLFGRQDTVMEGSLVVRLIMIPQLTFLQILILMLG